MNNNQNILSDKKISRIDEILLKSKIIPILVEDDINNAFKAVEALLDGGITVIDLFKDPQKDNVISALNITTHLGGILDSTASGAL